MRKYYEKIDIEKTRVIGLNGSKCCGKTSITEMLEAAGYGFIVNFFLLRDDFYTRFYSRLNREHLKQHEVNGASSLGWFALDYHWRVKPFADSTGCNVIFDHYLADYCIQILGSSDYVLKSSFGKLINTLEIPAALGRNQFYLDIDYDTYLYRREERRKELPDIPDTRVIERDLYARRRSHYKRLVDEGWLTEIDATQSKEKVFKTITKQVKK